MSTSSFFLICKDKTAHNPPFLPIPNIAYMSALKYCRQTTAQTAGEHINLLYSQTSFELYNYNIKLDTEAAFLFYGGIKFIPV